MNVVERFLHENHERLGLASLGLEAPLTTLLVTPRFRASRHVVMLVLERGGRLPVVVAKLPRLPEDRAGVAREAENLRVAHGSRSGGFETIPRVVAFEDYLGYPVLVETALVGAPLNPAAIRQDRAGSIEAVVAWLRELPHVPDPGDGWFERLLEQPLRCFAAALAAGGREERLVEETLEELEALRGASVPLVLEHGDLSHPNLLRLRDGRAAVIDWELAEPRGLPLHDLCFFLSYVALADGDGARGAPDEVAIFHDAFLRADGWARAVLESYADALELDRSLLGTLILACWARHTAGLVDRLALSGDPSVDVSTESADWVRSSRSYALWRHALLHAEGYDRGRARSPGRGEPVGS